MQLAFLIIGCVLVSSWSSVLRNETWLGDLQLLLAATGLFVAARFASARDIRYLVLTLRIAMAAFGVAAIWIAFQWAPLDIGSNPIWESVAAALGEPVRGRISIDPPATLRCLFTVVMAFAIMMASAAVTLNRVRAERCLALIWVVMIGGTALSSLSDLSVHPGAGLAEGGVILSLGCGYLVYERFETRFTRMPHRWLKLVSIEGLLLGTAAGCAMRMNATSHIGSLLGTAAGAFVMLSIAFARRFGLSRWQMIAIAIFILVAGVISFAKLSPHGSPVLALSTASPIVREETLRMVEEATILGTGAGTMDALARLYSPNVERGFVSASSAARIQIEIGWPAAVIAGLFLTMIGFVLLRGALSRGRDSVYALTGIGFVVSLAVSVLCEDGIESRALIIPASALLGLALAQSQSQSR